VNSRISAPRPGIPLVDVVAIIVVFTVVVGLLFVAVQRVRLTYAQKRSQLNLQQIGIAMNNYAGANYNQLPNVGPGNAPFIFCGQTGGTAKRPGQPSPGPDYQNGLLSFMGGDVKALAAPLDPNLGNSNPVGSPCSYSIPAYWTTMTTTGILVLPASFQRGTSQCIGAAEMTTQGINYANILPFAHEPYTPALANTPSTNANNFSRSGCQVVLMDGSVRMIDPCANVCGEFELAQEPYDKNAWFGPSNW
jgi:hypothetical protein